MGKVIIFSAPSGCGKTTIIHEILKVFPDLEFSVSATSRQPRSGEVDGRDYYFMTRDQFQEGIKDGLFVEWEEVYSGTCYGTLQSELKRIWDKGHSIVFDVDAVGGINLKKIFGDDARSIFIMPPSIDTLHERLVRRGTDSEDVIAKRVAKAQFEIDKSSQFDFVVVNDSLDEAVDEVSNIVNNFLNR